MRDQARALITALNTLEAKRSQSPAICRRNFRRHVVRAEGLLYPMSVRTESGEPLPIQIRDVGWGGIGFVCSLAVPPNSRWRPCIVRHGQVLAEQPIAVRHSQLVQDDVYLVGGQYCAEGSLLYLLGVELADMADSLNEAEMMEGQFLPPDQAG
ncbi:MAG: hypothetical protein IT443_10875 [Phycisphaeraceae bacterium]|nr:hypothetical protein [Phycisphaeraceae bacterium]